MKKILINVFVFIILSGLILSSYNLGEFNTLEEVVNDIMPNKNKCEQFCKSIDDNEDIILSCQVGCLYSTNLQLEFIQNSYLD